METIITATDFSERSLSAMREAARLAKAQDAKLIAVNVVDPVHTHSVWGQWIGDLDEMVARAKRERVAKMASIFKEKIDVALNEDRLELRVLEGSPADQILYTARTERASMIVIGTAGHGQIAAALLGSTANEVVCKSQRPVLVVPDDDKGRRIPNHKAPMLVAVDFSRVSLATFEFALAYARAHDRKIILAHAVGPAPTSLVNAGFPISVTPDLVERMIEAQHSGLAQVVETLDANDVVEEIRVEVGDAHHVIVKLVEECDASLVCMGTHGRRGLRKLLLGNTAERVLRDVPCPVLVTQQSLASDSPLHGAITQTEDASSEDE